MMLAPRIAARSRTLAALRLRESSLNIALYYAPISCSMVPYIALTEAGADFEVRTINFMKGMHVAEDFLRMNPKHAVPVLVVDDRPLTENVAILQWIADAFPAARLLPQNGWSRFQCVSLLAWFASGIHPFLTPNVMPQRYCDIPGTEDGVRRAAHKMLTEKLQVAEAMLANREWFMDFFTIADAYFFWCFRRMTQFQVDVTPFANCGAHFERVSKRPSVVKLLAFEAQTLAEFKKAS